MKCPERDRLFVKANLASEGASRASEALLKVAADVSTEDYRLLLLDYIRLEDIATETSQAFQNHLKTHGCNEPDRR